MKRKLDKHGQNLLSLYGKEQPGHSAKHLLLCSTGFESHENE